MGVSGPIRKHEEKLVPLYKYLPLEFARSMVDDGCVRIGTLLEYRNEEEYGPDVGDESEGTSIHLSHIGDVKGATQEDLNWVQRQVIRIDKGAERIQLSNSRVRVTSQSRDLYIYSTSHVFSPSIMRDLSRDLSAPYNACVRISDPDKFTQEVSASLKGVGAYRDRLRCVYEPRSQYYSGSEEPSHPAVIKDPKYEYQKEVRIIWEPLSEEPISPQMLQVENIKELCEIIYIDNGHNSYGMAEIRDTRFDNDRVLLDAMSYINCEFHGCTIVFSGKLPMTLSLCRFYGCVWELCGAARSTIRFLGRLYRDLGEGGRAVVEGILAGIKSSTDH